MEQEKLIIAFKAGHRNGLESAQDKLDNLVLDNLRLKQTIKQIEQKNKFLADNLFAEKLNNSELKNKLNNLTNNSLIDTETLDLDKGTKDILLNLLCFDEGEKTLEESQLTVSCLIESLINCIDNLRELDSLTHTKKQTFISLLTDIKFKKDLQNLVYEISLK